MFISKYLIVKNVLSIDGLTTSHYFILQSSDINMDFLKQKNIISYHPLIIKDGSNFYYLKGLKSTDYLILNFCANDINLNDNNYASLIFENYFLHNSFDL